MSRSVELRPLTVTVIRLSASASRTAAAGTPSTTNETMPEGRRPRSVTVTPGMSSNSDRRSVARALTADATSSIPSASRYSTAAPSPSRAATSDSHSSKRVASPASSYRSGAVQVAARVGGHRLDHRVVLWCPLQRRDRVARVLGARQQDSVAGGERHRVEELRPGPGRAVDERDALRRAAEEPRKDLPHAGELGRALVLRRVAA